MSLSIVTQAASPSVVVTQTGKNGSVKILFEDIAFAAFEDNGVLKIGLPESTNLRFQGFSKYSKPSKIQGSGGFLLQMPIPEALTPVVFRKGEKTFIEFQKRVGQTHLPDHFLTSKELKVASDGQTAQLNIPPQSLIRVFHEKEGRSTWLIPTKNPAVGVSARFLKPHMVFLPTLQGMVLKADATVLIEPKESFFEISRPGGLGFSTIQEDSFGFQKHKETHDLSALSVHLKPIWKLIREEKSQEALAVIRGIIRKHPEFDSLASFQQLKGMAFLQMNELGKALPYFSGESLEKSSAPWIQTIYLKNGHPEGVKKFIENLDSLKKVPQPFLGNLLLLAIQGAVTGGQAQEASFLFKKLPESLTDGQKKLADDLKKQLIFEPLLPSTLEDTADLTHSRARLRHDAQVQTKFENILASLNVGKIGRKKALEQLKAIEWDTFTPSFEKDILKKMAELEGQEGHYRAALTLYKKMERRDLEESPSRNIRAEFLLTKALEDPQFLWFKKVSLFREFKKFISGADQKEQMILTLGKLLLDQDCPRLAQEFLKENLESKPTPEIILKMAEAYLNRGLTQELFLLVSKESPNLPVSVRPRLDFIKAKGLFQEGQFQKALESLPSEGGSPEINYFRATLLRKLGKLDEAVRVFEDLMRYQTFPTRDLLDQIALCLCDLGDPIRLKAFFKKKNAQNKEEASYFLKALETIRPLPTPTTLPALKKDIERLGPLVSIDISQF